jgi:hypothetical protein
MVGFDMARAYLRPRGERGSRPFPLCLSPGIAIPVLLGAFGEEIGNGWLVWVLAATVGWAILCTRPPRQALGEPL